MKKAILFGALCCLICCQQPQKTGPGDEASSVIELAKRDLGFPFDEDQIRSDTRIDKELIVVDFSDAKELTRYVRILAKQLAASSDYTQKQLKQIKFAMLDAESALKDSGSLREIGRVILGEYIDTLEAI